MNQILVIKEFLKERRPLDSMPSSGNPFITISRQAGAGGHFLSEALVAEFKKNKDEQLFQGWHVFDRELTEVIAEDPLLSQKLDELLSERYHSELREFLDSLFSGATEQYKFYKQVYRVAYALAAVGKVILLGRCGGYVTQRLPGGLHLRLIAPEPQRILWIMKKFKIPHDEAQKLIEQRDVDRNKLAKSFFSHNINDPLYYDMVWNTARVDLREMVAITTQMVTFRAEQAAHRSTPTMTIGGN
ncbi:MAG: cytidylate kinase-like family protein [bacterium]